jgi:hypothetical protein
MAPDPCSALFVGNGFATLVRVRSCRRHARLRSDLRKWTVVDVREPPPAALAVWGPGVRLHPLEQAVLPWEGGLTRLWLELWSLDRLHRAAAERSSGWRLPSLKPASRGCRCARSRSGAECGCVPAVVQPDLAAARLGQQPLPGAQSDFRSIGFPLAVRRPGRGPAAERALRRWHWPRR